METTINVQEVKTNGDWTNIVTSDGKLIAINTKSCPKLKAALDIAQAVPFPLTGNLVTKDNKNYLWDPKPEGEKKPFFTGGGFKKADVPQEPIWAQCAIKSAVDLYASLPEVTPEKVVIAAEKFYVFIASKDKRAKE